MKGLNLYVFGSSLTSAFWNGAATYYRGLYKNLHQLGYRITFAEPDIYNRLQHRDWPPGEDPPYARCPVYRGRAELEGCLRAARDADLIIKHSGVGAEDEFLEAAVLDAAAAAPAGARPRVAFWDVDAPATLAALEADEADEADEAAAAAPMPGLRRHLCSYDFVFTYGGGPPVVERYLRLGARCCYPVYNGLDPDTHFPEPPVDAWRSDVMFLGHRLPDREERVQRFFLGAARRDPQHQYLLAGEGWEGAEVGANVRRCGYVSPSQHNRLNASARLVVNLNRDSMARAGFSPPTRIFEAAGAAATIVSDAWAGMALFFEPGREILLASGPDDIRDYAAGLAPAAAALMGQRARQRALADHTYARRAARVHRLLHAAAGPSAGLGSASASASATGPARVAA